VPCKASRARKISLAKTFKPVSVIEQFVNVIGLIDFLQKILQLVDYSSCTFGKTLIEI